MKKLLLLLTALLCLTGCEAPPAENVTTVSTDPPGETQPVETQPVQIPSICITEVMPQNTNLCLGHDKDWVELYNPGETPVDLDGLYLTDDPVSGGILNLDGLVIPGEGYLVVVLDGDFGLSSAGETVYLAQGEALVSQLTYDALSVGREMFCFSGRCCSRL